jgi:septum formation protein
MTTWLPSRPLLLASTSPTRRRLLIEADLAPDVEAPAVDERLVEISLEGASRRDVAAALALAKAQDVSGRHPGRHVLGADQTLDCDGRSFHKPSGPEEAIEHLLALSGRKHVLHSAAVIVLDGNVLAAFDDQAVLTMRHMSRAKIAEYVAAAGDEATSSVGAYRIEGLGSRLFERVEGAQSTIQGLPVLPLLGALWRLNLVTR